MRTGTEKSDRVDDVYDLGIVLGEGSFAKVVRGTHKESKDQRAIKIVNKAELKNSHTEIIEEIDILKKVGHHPHIICLHEVYSDDKNFYLVMDLCRGGDLFSKIVSEGSFSEKDAATYCWQLATALDFMHKKGVTHRDLKPENLLLNDSKNMSDLKVADFGLSKFIESQSQMKTVCGTWAYAAPEIIKRMPYSNSVDIWSLGVLQFVLLSGYHPFDVYGDLPEPQLLRKIVMCKYDFDDEVWQGVSQEAMDLIKKLLQVNPKNRMTLEDYLNDPWITGNGVQHNEESNPHMINKLHALMTAKTAIKKMHLNVEKHKQERAEAGAVIEEGEEEEEQQMVMVTTVDAPDVTADVPPVP